MEGVCTRSEPTQAVSSSKIDARVFHWEFIPEEMYMCGG
jgi:hypothetical protein